MSPIAFVGDARTASGYRLAGVATHIATAHEAELAFRRACAAARVVLVACDTALGLPLPTLEAAMAALDPLVLIVPDAAGRRAPIDPGARVRRQLGLEG
jgi:vacuolar-type H+-ATPase subunit F/Vma7